VRIAPRLAFAGRWILHEPLAVPDKTSGIEARCARSRSHARRDRGSLYFTRNGRRGRRFFRRSAAWRSPTASCRWRTRKIFVGQRRPLQVGDPPAADSLDGVSITQAAGRVRLIDPAAHARCVLADRSFRKSAFIVPLKPTCSSLIGPSARVMIRRTRCSIMMLCCSVHLVERKSAEYAALR
jgi:hypothetical protein